MIADKTTTTMMRGGDMPNPTSRFDLPYLRAWRLQKVLTQDQLAEAAGVGAATVPRAEAGKPVNAITAAKLARALGVTIKQLQAVDPEGGA
jgi:transcriptional regulator with XRE-family HTH domain